MRQQEITVSLGGGYPLDQAGLAKLIESYPGLTIIPFDAESPPHVLIWFLNGDQAYDLSLSQAITAVLFLIGKPDFQSLPQNISGLFSKEESSSSLAAAIRQVARGEQYISPSLALAYLESQQPQGLEKRNSAFETLSDREKEILDLLSQGQSNKTIAARLYLSVRTVEGHLASIYAKLGVHARTEAMLVAIESR
jgi:DNA-binding CsgD family transcriptional regulator